MACKVIYMHVPLVYRLCLQGDERTGVEGCRQVFWARGSVRREWKRKGVWSEDKCLGEGSGQMFKGRETDGRDINPPLPLPLINRL